MNRTEKKLHKARAQYLYILVESALVDNINTFDRLKDIFSTEIKYSKEGTVTEFEALPAELCEVEVQLTIAKAALSRAEQAAYQLALKAGFAPGTPDPTPSKGQTGQ